MPDEQEAQAPAVTGDETVADIKVDYSRATSQQFTSWLNRDHAIIAALLGKSAGGSLGMGVGRIVDGLKVTEGRIEADTPSALDIQLPNGVYVVDGQSITVDNVGGYEVLTLPANMVAPGKFVYLSLDEEGNPEVLPGNCYTPAVGGAPLSGAPTNLPCLGLVVTDASSVVSIDYLYTDEIVTPSKLLIMQRLLQKQVDALSSVGGGGEGGPGGAARADLLPWNLAEIDTDTVTKVLSLIDALKIELTDYIDQGRTKTMQTDNDHFVSGLMNLLAVVSRLAPDAVDLMEVAQVQVGFTGHSVTGVFADPGINGTDNKLRHSTLILDTVNRTMRPGS